MSQLRADAPAYNPGLAVSIASTKGSQKNPPLKTSRKQTAPRNTSQAASADSSTTATTKVTAHSNKKRAQRRERARVNRAHGPLLVHPSLLSDLDNDSPACMTELIAQASTPESFPALTNTAIPKTMHDIWRQTDHIQETVAREWDPWTMEVQTSSSQNQAETSLEDLTRSLGLTLLQSQSSKQQESENDCNYDSAAVDEAAQVDPLLVTRRRLNYSKLRDKMFESLYNQRSMLQTAVVEASVNETDLLTQDETTAAVDFTAPTCWEYVDTSRPATPPPLLDSCYVNSDNPLHHAIENNDELAVKLLLHNEANIDVVSEGHSPVQLAVARNRPNLLRILLTSRHVSSLPDGSDYLPAPHLAVKNGSEECLQLLLTHSLNNALTRDAHDGNNLLHICCRRTVPVSTLQLVLYVLSNSSSTLVSKAMLSTNNRNETPLHVACRHGLTSRVEVFLSSLNFTLLSKLFQAKDVDEQTPFLAAVASGSTNVVMSMFMWRGNNQIKMSTKSIHCPLSWAVKTKNVDMVQLLLEFNDPCGRGYDLTGALRATMDDSDVIDDEHDDETVAEICRVLVQAGANPCEANGNTGESTILLAVRQRRNLALATLLDTYDAHLQRIRSERRRDPVLQKQPESFFAGMDSRESAQRSSTLRDALVTALYYFYAGDQHDSHASFPCAQVLFRRSANLDALGLLRLRHSISTRAIQRDFTPSAPADQQFTYQAAHAEALNPNNEMQWNMSMLHMPWMACDNTLETTACFFVKANSGRGSFPRPDVTIISAGGKRLVGHAAVLSRRSEKLSAAIRFDEMTRTSPGVLQIPMDMPSELCILFLEHSYHGSMLSFKVNHADPVEAVHRLLDIFVMADEYIVPTLTQECIMRLLSSDPCQCLCRSCTKQVYDPALSWYQVTGPSVCITADTCLDILAVIQHLRNHGSASSSSVLVSWEENSLWGPATRHEMSVDSLDTVNVAVHRFVLLHFDELMQRNLLDEACNDADADEITQFEKTQQLLRLSLDEYMTCPIGASVRQVVPNQPVAVVAGTGNAIDLDRPADSVATT